VVSLDMAYCSFRRSWQGSRLLLPALVLGVGQGAFPKRLPCSSSIFLPPTSKLVRASMPCCSNNLCQPRIVSFEEDKERT
jgi:hypothetical protein